MNFGRPFDGRLFRNGCEFLYSEKRAYQLDLPKEEAMKVAAEADNARLFFDLQCFTKWRADGSLRCFFMEKDGEIVDADEETLKRQMRKCPDWKKGIKQGWIVDDEDERNEHITVMTVEGRSSKWDKSTW
jgi:hypothetical protein